VEVPLDREATFPDAFTDGIRPRWQPRVPQHQIRRLYENDARGILDEDLVQEVAISLYLRCQSILVATEAHEGRAACPRCGGKIPHDWNKNALITCAGCGWQTTWGAYFKTYQDKQLVGGGAMFAFKAYVEEYPKTDSARLRWLLVDRLIHVFHNELRGQPSRPAACNVIGGKLHDVEALLNELAYGEGSTPEALQQQSAFRQKTDLRDDYFRALREAKLQRTGGRPEGD
jgi:hypothetical protein